jgi:hypothetical protein
VANDDLKREQQVFDLELPQMLKAHRGQHVVIHDGAIVDFWSTYADAYAAALDRFGLDATFLVAEIREPRVATTSLAWTFGGLAR